MSVPSEHSLNCSKRYSMKHIFELHMSVKFELKFESLLESLVDHTVIDDIKAKTFHNEHRKKYVLPFSRRDNYRDKF